MAAEQKKGKKPTGPIENLKVAQGQQKPPAQSEVSGHLASSGTVSPGAYYICWNDQAVNWVPYGWDHFYCWNCHALNV